VEQIARNTAMLMQTEAYGFYHMTCQGQCSWYEFAAEIFRMLKIKKSRHACPSTGFPSGVMRPQYSVLQNKHLQDLQLDHLTDWQQSVGQFLSREYLSGQV
jgi:dTDP-4-dehydrorhamnose reductase